MSAAAARPASGPTTEYFPPIPAGVPVVRVGTGKIETVMASFAKPISTLVVEYLGNKEIYGKEYITRLVLRQAKALASQGYYVFVHGQSLSHAARTEKDQQPHARALGDTSGALWGERRMLMRTPETAVDLPASAKEYNRKFRIPICDRVEPHKSALMSVDFMFMNRGEAESAFYFCGPLSLKVGPPAFRRLGGRFYLFAVAPEVIQDERENFVYRSKPFGVPDRMWVGSQADGLKPDFVTDRLIQARFVMQGYMKALLKGQVRVFVYDALSYAQRRWYGDELAKCSEASAEAAKGKKG